MKSTHGGATRSRLARWVRAAVVTAVAVPIAVFVAPPAALASTHLCLTNLPNLCIGVNAVAHGATVYSVAPPGRNLTIVAVPHTNNQVKIEFYDPDFCVGIAPPDWEVVVRYCQGDTGTVWYETVNANGHVQFESRAYPGNYLAVYGPNPVSFIIFAKDTDYYWNFN